jgi:hypothetical protein
MRNTKEPTDSLEAAAPGSVCLVRCSADTLAAYVLDRVTTARVYGRALQSAGIATIGAPYIERRRVAHYGLSEEQARLLYGLDVEHRKRLSRIKRDLQTEYTYRADHIKANGADPGPEPLGL